MHHTEQTGHCHNRFAPYTWPYSRGKAKHYGDQLHLILDGDLCNRDFKRLAKIRLRRNDRRAICEGLREIEAL